MVSKHAVSADCAFQVWLPLCPCHGVAAFTLCADLIRAAIVGSPLQLCWANLWFRISYSIRQVFSWMSGLLVNAFLFTTVAPSINFHLVSLFPVQMGDLTREPELEALGMTGPGGPGAVWCHLYSWDSRTPVPFLSLFQPSTPDSFAQASSV